MRPPPESPSAAKRWLDPGGRSGADDTPPRGLVELADALLKSPARVLVAIEREPLALLGLGALAACGLAVTGVGIATFSGDLQLLAVPVKLVLGTLLCAVLCLPSLHVFSCLSGATQTLRQTWGALSMGLALMSILLVGFAPVVWVFAQATSSVALVGALHLGFFLASATLGLALTRRALAALNDAPVRATGVWSVMFVLVMLQMATTLRPIVGAFDGFALHERAFFLAHWFS